MPTSAEESPTRDPWIVFVRTENPEAVERAAGQRGLRDAKGVGFVFHDDEKAQRLASQLTRAGYIVVYGPEQKVAAEEGIDCSHSHPPSVPTLPCGAEEDSKLSKAQRAKLEREVWAKTPFENRTKHGRDRAILTGEFNPKANKFFTVRPLSSFTDDELRQMSGTSMAAEAPFATTERDPKVVDAGKKWGNMSNARKVYDALQESCNKESQEVFLVIPLDLHGDPCSPPVEIARGQRDRVNVDASDVMRPVITSNCSGFVVVHNHPSGHAKPSDADRSLTKNIQKAAKPYAPVTMIDHVIVGRHEFYSIVEDKLYRVK